MGMKVRDKKVKGWVDVDYMPLVSYHMTTKRESAIWAEMAKIAAEKGIEIHLHKYPFGKDN